MALKEITLAIDSDLRNVSSIGTALGDLRSVIGLSDSALYEIELCVVEAATNCIKHAYEKEKGHKVEIHFALYEDRIVVDICDTGKPMDVRALDQADVAALEVDHNDPDNIPEAGRGILIMKKIMDDVIYTRRGGKNCLTLVKSFVGF